MPARRGTIADAAAAAQTAEAASEDYDDASAGDDVCDNEMPGADVH